MNFPLRGDESFIKNLKKGDILYNIELEWNPDKCKAEVNVKDIKFDQYEKDEEGKTVKRANEGGDVGAVLTKGGIQTEKHNIMYGFYKTPLDALEAFKKLTEAMDDAAKEGIKKENRRLKRLVEKMAKQGEVNGSK